MYPGFVIPVAAPPAREAGGVLFASRASQAPLSANAPRHPHRPAMLEGLGLDDLAHRAMVVAIKTRMPPVMPGRRRGSKSCSAKCRNGKDDGANKLFHNILLEKPPPAMGSKLARQK